MADVIVSLESGKLETITGGHTIADGISVKTPGSNTFEIVKKYVDADGDDGSRNIRT